VIWLDAGDDAIAMAVVYVLIYTVKVLALLPIPVLLGMNGLLLLWIVINLLRS